MRKLGIVPGSSARVAAARMRVSREVNVYVMSCQRNIEDSRRAVDEGWLLYAKASIPEIWEALAPSLFSLEVIELNINYLPLQAHSCYVCMATRPSRHVL